MARTLRRCVAVLTVGVLAATAWTGWRVWQVDRSLTAAQADASALTAALGAGDPTAARRATAGLRAHSGMARARTAGPTWSLLGHLPVYGADARAVARVSAVLDDLSRTGVPPLVASAAEPDALLPRDGRLPVEALAELRRPVTTADAAFARARDDLAAADTAQVHAPLASRMRTLRTEVTRAASGLRTARSALDLMPVMLGADGPRDYLVVVQNNAEIRATGGLPGAMLLLHVDNGALTITRQTGAGPLGVADAPALPLTRAERALYGDQLGTFFADANLTPDFPRAASLWAARWEQVFPTDHLDGVLAVDPVTLSYLLEATGPVTVGPQTLGAADAVADLLSRTYLDLADPIAQDQHFQQVAAAVFTRLTTDPGIDPGNAPGVLRALQRAGSEGRVRLWSAHPGEQQALAATTLGGALDRGPRTSPQVGVYLNDTTGSKLSYYLRYAAHARSTACRSGVQTLAATAALSSTAPVDAAATLPVAVSGGGLRGVDPGVELVTLRIHGPEGGRFGDVVLDGRRLSDVRVVEQDGRPVATVYVQLAPQRAAALAWTMTTGPGQTGAGRLDVTPGVVPGDASSSFGSSC